VAQPYRMKSLMSEGNEGILLNQRKEAWVVDEFRPQGKFAEKGPDQNHTRKNKKKWESQKGGRDGGGECWSSYMFNGRIKGQVTQKEEGHQRKIVGEKVHAYPLPRGEKLTTKRGSPTKAEKAV